MTFFVFAETSYSLIGYRAADGEIMECDKEELSLLYSCASNSDRFLDAIFYILELRAKRLQGLVQTNDAKVNEQYVKQCTESAGGNKYLKFFRMLIL